MRLAPPPFRSDPDLNAVLDALPQARIVGGAVRDLLARRIIADIDLATPAPPEQTIAALRRAGLKAIPTGIAHGTVTAVAGQRCFEVTTLRRDIETDGRHAVVAFTDDWRLDAERRDFTINALSMTRDGAIFDYSGGIGDLRAGILRFVGDPAARIAEDYLRVLRFFRFFGRYAVADPDAATLIALRQGVAGLPSLSVERVWHELSRILSAPDPTRSIRLMEALGVLAAILPEGADPAGLEHLVAAGGPCNPVVRLAALLTGDARAVAGRLKLPVAERIRLIALRSIAVLPAGAVPPAGAVLPAGAVPPAGVADAGLRRILAGCEPAMLLCAGWVRGLDPATLARIAAMAQPVFPLEGRDVLALGVAPGPEVGRLLRAVRDWWLASGCEATSNGCAQELARAVANPLAPSAG